MGDGAVKRPWMMVKGASDMLAYDILHTEDEKERSNSSFFCVFFPF